MKSPWDKRLFEMRLPPDRRRVRDFRTTAGGVVYAVSTGKYTGHGATIIIVPSHGGRACRSVARSSLRRCSSKFNATHLEPLSAEHRSRRRQAR
jgi:hypothetical protein